MLVAHISFAALCMSATDYNSTVSIDSGSQVNFSEQANSQIGSPRILRTVCIKSYRPIVHLSGPKKNVL